jgi:hypothetical protein
MLPVASPTRWFDDVQMGPHCGGDTAEMPRKTQANPMTGISDFVQQSHNFIAVW